MSRPSVFVKAILYPIGFVSMIVLVAYDLLVKDKDLGAPDKKRLK